MKNKFVVVVFILAFLISMGLLIFSIKNNNIGNNSDDEIVLKTNAGVPYDWYYTIEDTSIVMYKNFKTVRETEKLGGLVEYHYTFTGLKEGSTNIRFEYKSTVDDTVKKVSNYIVSVDKNLNVKIKKSAFQ